MLGSLATAQEMADASQPTMPAQQLRVLMQFAHNESLLAALGASKEVDFLPLLQRIATVKPACLMADMTGNYEHCPPWCRCSCWALWRILLLPCVCIKWASSVGTSKIM